MLPIYKVQDPVQVGRYTSITVTYGTDVTITLATALVQGETYEATIEYYAGKAYSLSLYAGDEKTELPDNSTSHKIVTANFEAAAAYTTLRLSLEAVSGASAFVANLIIRKVSGGTRERYVAEKWEFHDTYMGSRYIQLTASSPTPIDWHVGDFLVYRGLTYTLNNVPVAVQSAYPNEASDGFVYENVRFDDDQGKLYDCMVLDITPTTGDYVESRGTNYTGSSVFTLYCAETVVSMRDANGVWHDVTLSPVAYLGGIVQANLNRLYPQDNWRVDVNPDLTGLDDKVISLNQWYVPQALAEIHNQWDVDFICLGKTIKIGYTLNNITGDDSESYVFAYGEGYAQRGDDEKSLFQIKRSANSSQHIITRLRAMGSTRNMPYRYYSKNYDLPQAMFINNLQLPDTFLPYTGQAVKKRPNDPNNKTQGNANRDATYGYDADNNPILRHVLGNTNDAYIDKLDNAASCPEGIREGSAFWDGSNADLEEIYPTIKSGTYRDLRAANIPDMDGRVPSEQSSPTSAYPHYDNDERIDVLLGTDSRANIGDGIMPEADARGQNQQIRLVRVAQKTLTWRQSGSSDFNSNGVAKDAYIDTLYTVLNVSAGAYQTEPVTQNVKLFVKYAPFGSSTATVRYRFRIYATSVEFGTTTLVAEHVSPVQLLLANGNFISVELPSIPNTDVDTRGEHDQTLNVSAVSDITVKFALEVVTNQGVTVGDGTFTYYIDSEQTDVEPQYIWEPQDSTDTIINTPFSIYIKDIGIDLSNISTTGEDAIIHFNTGACGGMEFKWNPNTATPIMVGSKKGWKIDVVERFTDDTIHAYYPNANSPLLADDQYVLLNIEFPDAYIRIAELRLLDAATKYLADNCEPKYTYEPEISDLFIQRNMDFCEAAGVPEKSVYWNLYAGYKFSMRGIPDKEDQILPLIDNVTIKDVTIRVGEQDIPHVEIVLNDEVEQSTLQKLSVTVDRIYNGIFGQGGNGGSSISYSTLISLLNSEGKKLFLSKKDKDTAAGRITFKQGIEAQAPSTTTGISNDGDIANSGELRQHGNVVIGDPGAQSGQATPITKSANFMSGMTGWFLDNFGNMEVESLTVRSFLEVTELLINRLQAQEGDTIFTDNDQITGIQRVVENEGTQNESVSYILDLKEKWEGYFTAQQRGNIVKGIINTLAAEQAGVIDGDDPDYINVYEAVSYSSTANPKELEYYERSGAGTEQSPYVYTLTEDTTMTYGKTYYKKTQGTDDGGNKYYTSWMQVVEDRNTEGSSLGNNQIRVVLYGDNQVPAQKNFEPCINMTIGRWGCFLNPNEDGISQAEKQSREKRQRLFFISASDGRIMKLRGVNKPILEQWNYGMTFGTIPDFMWQWQQVAEKALPNRDYLFAQGLIYQSLIKVDPQGQPVPHYVDCGNWVNGATGTPTVGKGIYLVNEYNPESGDWEIHDVWAYGCKWRCLRHQPYVHDGQTTYVAPKWCNRDDWQMIEGNDNFSMELLSSNGNSFRIGFVDTVITPYVYYGNTDITSDILESAFYWTRKTMNTDGTSTADQAWNTNHKTRVLHLTNADMPIAWSRENKAIFTCSVVINDGKSEIIIDNQVIV